MSLQSKPIAIAQAVGQSTAVKMDATPFLARHAGVAELTSSNDRVVKLQESNDNEVTWTDVAGASVSTGTARFPIALMADAYRIDVSGGTTGTGSGNIEA